MAVPMKAVIKLDLILKATLSLKILILKWLMHPVFYATQVEQTKKADATGRENSGTATAMYF